MGNTQAATTKTYAEQWAGPINEVYRLDWFDALESASLNYYGDEDEPFEVTAHRVLARAADCLRNGATATFTGPDLDIIRELMPFHEVHQSGAKRWVLDKFDSAYPAAVNGEGDR